LDQSGSSHACDRELKIVAPTPQSYPNAPLKRKRLMPRDLSLHFDTT